MTTSPCPEAPWRARFWVFFGGQALSLVGSALTQFVLMWWITQSTGSARALAGAALSGLLPMALLSPFAGVLVDRLSRRRVMIISDGITAACMLVLVGAFAHGKPSLGLVYALMAVRSAMQAFQHPAAKASVSLLVPESFLPRVAGLNQAMEGVMVIGAAPLGALALAGLDFQGALMIDVLTAALAILSLAFMKLPNPPRLTQASTFRADLAEGAQHVARHPGLRLAFLLEALVVLILMPALSLTPLFVKEHLRGGLQTVAFMELLSGLGILLGGLAVGLLGARIRRMAFVLAAFGLSCATVGLTALVPSGGPAALAAGWWFVGSFAYAMGGAPFTAILQSVVPKGLQGRVFALMNATHATAAPIGLALTGFLGDAFGIRAVFLGAGFLATLPYLFAYGSDALLGLGRGASARAPSSPAEDEA